MAVFVRSERIPVKKITMDENNPPGSGFTLIDNFWVTCVQPV